MMGVLADPHHHFYPYRVIVMGRIARELRQRNMLFAERLIVKLCVKKDQEAELEEAVAMR